MNMPDPAPLNFSLNAAAADLDPLIITSPVPRSGTTLLQRLLCSSRRALIYGEKCSYDLEFFLNIYAYKAQEYAFQQERYEHELQKVLRGEVNGWILDLSPDVAGYLAAMKAAAFAGIAYCRDYAMSVGRPVWGFKYPGWNAATIQLLQAVMPKARFLFIIRDLIPCLKSAKAQRLVITPADVQGFCQKWASGVAYCRSQQSNKSILVISFEALVDDPGAVTREIAVFSGIHDVDISVLEKKINAPTGQGFETQIKDGYVPPEELNEAELQIADDVVAAVGQPLNA